MKLGRYVYSSTQKFQVLKYCTVLWPLLISLNISNIIDILGFSLFKIPMPHTHLTGSSCLKNSPISFYVNPRSFAVLTLLSNYSAYGGNSSLAVFPLSMTGFTSSCSELITTIRDCCQFIQGLVLSKWWPSPLLYMIKCRT